VNYGPPTITAIIATKDLARNCLNGGDYCISIPSTTDVSIWRREMFQYVLSSPSLSGIKLKPRFS